VLIDEGGAHGVVAHSPAFAGDLDVDGQPVTAGSTTVPNCAAAKASAPLLRPTGETFGRTFTRGTRSLTTVTVIEALVVEVDADASADLDPADLT
jgi:hypothetical protein